MFNWLYEYGGSDAPRSINCELGVPGSSTICLNSPTVRTLAGVPAGAISLCNFYGKSNQIPLSADILVVAGGGGNWTGVSGGSGAGGVLMCCSIGPPTITRCTSYSIQVGGGGGCNSRGTSSCFFSIVTCGGGGGGHYTPNPVAPFAQGCLSGQAGGSGGGSNYSPTSFGCAVNNCLEGREGAGSGPGGGGSYCAGGGGGKSAAGGNPAGGQGCFYPITQAVSHGDLRNGCYWVGGGGGGTQGRTNPPGRPNGGFGGGGDSGFNVGPSYCGGCPGMTNTGGGAGGGGGGYTVPSGGSGVVLIKYNSGLPDACTTGTPCYCCTGGFKYYIFKGSGTIAFCCTT